MSTNFQKSSFTDLNIFNSHSKIRSQFFHFTSKTLFKIANAFKSLYVLKNKRNVRKT